MRIIVVGGGIGGLTTAIALSMVGIDVEVYERAPELREVGAGIALASNALRALDLLGLTSSIHVRRMEGTIRDRRGRVLTSISGALPDKIGRMAIMHRADLLSLLARHLDPARIHLGRTFKGLEQDAGGVMASFDTGEAVRGDALIGADGLRSAVRTQLFGERAVRYAGYTGWRAVLQFPDATNLVVTETWGRGRRFGIVPMGGGHLYWFATRNAPEGERDPAGRTKEAVAQLFRGWHQPIESIIEATNQDAILRNDIYDLIPLPHLVQGRVALLGDAAHAVTPNLGQGACQAIEDSVVIAACLKTAGTAESGLLEYERRRLPRVTEVYRRSRNMGVVGQLENPAACWLRSSIMRAAPNGTSLRQMQSVMGFEALSPADQALFAPSATP